MWGKKPNQTKNSKHTKQARPTPVRVCSDMIPCYPSCAQEERESKLPLLLSPTLPPSAPEFWFADAELKLVCILTSGAVWAASFIL